MKIIILTESKRNIGYGHLSRCLSLYKFFESKKNEVILIIDGDETILEKISGKETIIIDWKNNLEKINEKLKESELTIIDSYLASEETYHKINNLTKRSAYFDDNSRINYPKGIIINGAPFATRISYSGNNNLLGTKYFPLRSEFKERLPKKISRKIENILITLGGDDIKNLTPKILKLLQEEYPNIIKTIIIGKAFQNITEIKKMKDLHTILIFSPSGKEMKKSLEQSDLVISGGGQTLFELAYLGVPCIAVQIADNQSNNINDLEEIGTIKFAGRYDSIGFLNKIKSLVETLQNPLTREKISKKGMSIIDEKGTDRIGLALLNYSQNNNFNK